jgi:hypothetical protein
MGVRYVLEGSVQKAGQYVRITAQLIAATTGYHLWSEQYDRPLTDIFTLQDKIVQKIVTTLRLQLTLQEQGQRVRKHTDNLEAYDAFLRGLESYLRFTREGNSQARQLWEQAVALDPQYAEALARLSTTYTLEWIWRWSADPQTLERALAQHKAAQPYVPPYHGLVAVLKNPKGYGWVARGARERELVCKAMSHKMFCTTDRKIFGLVQTVKEHQARSQCRTRRR